MLLYKIKYKKLENFKKRIDIKSWLAYTNNEKVKVFLHFEEIQSKDR